MLKGLIKNYIQTAGIARIIPGNWHVWSLTIIRSQILYFRQENIIEAVGGGEGGLY
jgi:hypothetical protein